MGPTSKSSVKRKRSRKDAIDNDIPRAFSRLMAFRQGIKPPSGLDDGIIKSKKRKRVSRVSEDAAPPEITSLGFEIPKIQPGERMTEFAARVDVALPVSGLIGRGTKGVRNLPGVKAPQTKMERRMQRMQKEWREVEAKRKERSEEALEDVESGEEGAALDTMMSTSKSGKKGKRRRGNGDDDPWAALAQARGKTSSTPGGLVGLHDVVQAPPQFLKAPTEKFRIQNGAKVDVSEIPSAAGSLRRREELGQARRSVVEGYRQMMKERKSATVT